MLMAILKHIGNIQANIHHEAWWGLIEKDFDDVLIEFWKSETAKGWTASTSSAATASRWDVSSTPL